MYICRKCIFLFLFISGLFNNGVRLQRTEWQNDQLIINTIGCGRNLSLYSLMYWPGVCLEELGTTTKFPFAIIFEPNMMEDCCPLCCYVPWRNKEQLLYFLCTRRTEQRCHAVLPFVCFPSETLSGLKFGIDGRHPRNEISADFWLRIRTGGRLL